MNPCEWPRCVVKQPLHGLINALSNRSNLDLAEECQIEKTHRITIDCSRS